jgi:hypothetical protein
MRGEQGGCVPGRATGAGGRSCRGAGGSPSFCSVPLFCRHVTAQGIQLPDASEGGSFAESAA